MRAEQRHERRTVEEAGLAQRQRGDELKRRASAHAIRPVAVRTVNFKIRAGAELQRLRPILRRAQARPLGRGSCGRGLEQAHVGQNRDLVFDAAAQRAEIGVAVELCRAEPDREMRLRSMANHTLAAAGIPPRATRDARYGSRLARLGHELRVGLGLVPSVRVKAPRALLAIHELRLDAPRAGRRANLQRAHHGTRVGEYPAIIVRRIDRHVLPTGYRQQPPRVRAVGPDAGVQFVRHHPGCWRVSRGRGEEARLAQATWKFRRGCQRGRHRHEPVNLAVVACH